MSKLSNRRKEKQITQVELANKIGITREMLSKYENGHVKRFNYEIVAKISNVLEIDKDDVIKEIKKSE